MSWPLSLPPSNPTSTFLAQIPRTIPQMASLFLLSPSLANSPKKINPLIPRARPVVVEFHLWLAVLITCVHLSLVISPSCWIANFLMVRGLQFHKPLWSLRCNDQGANVRFLRHEDSSVRRWRPARVVELPPFYSLDDSFQLEIIVIILESLRSPLFLAKWTHLLSYVHPLFLRTGFSYRRHIHELFKVHTSGSRIISYPTAHNEQESH